ncbi:tetratricopeptide repeat protein [Thiocystis violascens]|uniref:Tetratricopeptide repeat protein n=1 Tax=Thiocystis violascens (strain ATCC 17096 / DSM 198 / 6111) TaxID=765911 RepID=I3YDV1_THIV6|nr:tetratricopeptide repeat protein [Thiocystis violascens]AFL75169.1 hypothetical protein Thivi_3296 [Thiocystis violascens DSM 198]
MSRLSPILLLSLSCSLGIDAADLPAPAAMGSALDPSLIDSSDVFGLVSELMPWDPNVSGADDAFARLIERDPWRALDEIESRLRSQGDMGGVIRWAPRLAQRLPSDSRASLLNALALAAAGQTAQAQAALDQIPVDGPVGTTAMYRPLARAFLLRAQRRFADALEAARQAGELDPRHPYPDNLIGRLRIEQGEVDAAISSFEDAIAKSDRFVPGFTNLGSARLLRRDDQGAHQAFDQALAIQPTNCPALIGLATLDQLESDARMAATRLLACVDADPSNLLARQRLVPVLLEQRDYAEAERHARALLDQDAPMARRLLGDILLRLDRPAEAREALVPLVSDDQAGYLLVYADLVENDLTGAQQRLRILNRQVAAAGPRFLELVVSIALGKEPTKTEIAELAKAPAGQPLADLITATALLSSGRFDEARPHWQRSESILAPFSLIGLEARTLDDAAFKLERPSFLLGFALYLKDLQPAAGRAFSAGLAHDPDSPFGRYFSALSQLALGDRQGAIKHLRHALIAAPKFFAAHTLLAGLSLETGDNAQAIEHFEAARRLHLDASVLVTLGMLHERQQNTDEAVRIYRQLIADFPDSFIGYNQLAWLYARRGENLGKALDLATRANEIQPGNSGVQDTLGWIFFQRGEYPQALEYARNANQIAKGSRPEILYHLARMDYAVDKNVEKVKKTLGDLLQGHPAFDGRDEASSFIDRLK